MRKASLQSLLLATSVFVQAGCTHESGSVVSGKFEPNEVAIREVPGSTLKELIDSELVYIDSMDVRWVAPRGTLTDGATVPRLALWVTDGRFNGKFLKAAIVHDAYCQEDNKSRCPAQFQTRPWQEVHRMFYYACLTGGTSSDMAALMFAGVWFGGPRWDDADRNLENVPNEVLIAGFSDCKRWIQGNAPNIKEIESWVDEREPTVLAVSKLELEAISALESGNMVRATTALKDSERILEQSIDELPNDLMLMSLKGYQHKNRATNYRRLDMEDKVEGELIKAEEVFDQIMKNEPNEPVALAGKGEVLILRKDYDRAEGFVRRSLEVDPNLPSARRDLQIIEGLRGSLQPN